MSLKKFNKSINFCTALSRSLAIIPNAGICSLIKMQHFQIFADSFNVFCTLTFYKCRLFADLLRKFSKLSKIIKIIKTSNFATYSARGTHIKLKTRESNLDTNLSKISWHSSTRLGFCRTTNNLFCRKPEMLESGIPAS